MSTQITSQFSIENWDETPLSKIEDGPQLIRAEVTQTYTGRLEGKSTLIYVITTFDETFSTFVGSEQFDGQLDGHQGSFVLNHKGTHENGVAKSRFEIIPNSGTGELSGIRGEGSFEATDAEVTLTLDYHFE